MIYLVSLSRFSGFLKFFREEIQQLFSPRWCTLLFESFTTELFSVFIFYYLSEEAAFITGISRGPPLSS